MLTKTLQSKRKPSHLKPIRFFRLLRQKVDAQCRQDGQVPLDKKGNMLFAKISLAATSTLIGSNFGAADVAPWDHGIPGPFLEQ